MKIPKSECPDIWIRLPRHKWPQSWSSIEDPVVSSRKESVRSSFGRTIMGKVIWEHPIETWLGENSKLGMSLCASSKRIILISVCGWHQIGWKKENIDLGEPTSFLDHVYLGCTQKQCQISKSTVDNYRTMFESRISAGGLEKLPFPQNLRISSWSYDIGRSCKEMCGTILWVGKQDDSATLQSIYSMHRWPPLQRRRNKSVGELSHVCSQNCSQMFIFGKNWTILYSMVSEQNCTIDHEMDQSMWQTIVSFDLLHSVHKWIQTILSCGKHCKTVQIGTVSRLRFCREILRTQNPLQVEHCAFSEAIRLFP